MNLRIHSLSGLPSSRPFLAAAVHGSCRMVAAVALAAPIVAMAQPAPPVCDGRLFLSQNSPTGLNLISTTTNPMTFTPVGSAASITYNALGYSPVTGQLYAMRTDSNGDHLLQVDQGSGVVTDLGAVSGLPASPVYNTGTVGSDGVYYVKPFGNTTAIYAINTATKTATTINLSQAFTASDMAWVGGAGGGLYSVADNGQLYAIDVTSGTVTAKGAADTTGGVLGAQFGGTNGLFGSANDGSGFYKIDLTTGKKTLISGAPGSSTNDGGNCPNAAIQFPAQLAITKTDGKTTYMPGSNVTYTITVTNAGPFTAINAKVSDPLPAGITNASWSCTASAGSTCQAGAQTGAIDDTVSVAQGGTLTYTLTLQVPAGFTGNLVNTATASLGPDNTGAGVSATDTDTPPGGTTQPPQAKPVPALDAAGLGLLGMALAGFAALGRRRALR